MGVGPAQLADATSLPPTVRRRPLLELFPLTSAFPGTAASPPTSPSYEAFYRLNEPPFSSSTDPKFLYHSAAHDRAAQDLLSAIGRRDSLVVVTGASGVGKTMLCRAIVEELDRRTLTCVLHDPPASIEELLQMVLATFGVISRDAVPLHAGALREELVRALRDFLASIVPLQAFAVVILDNAHGLADDVLASLSTLLDAGGRERMLQVVLVGRPLLMERLAQWNFRHVKRRIAARSELTPLAPDDIVGYVMQRLASAGARTRVLDLDDAAAVKLYEGTAGVPAAVNAVCERVLTIGCERTARVVDAGLIAAVAADAAVATPTRARGRFKRRAAGALLMLALLGAGAATAAWIFRGRLSIAVRRWEAVPPPPDSPALKLPAPLTPLPTPATPPDVVR